jgi:hypothetical protein
VVCRGAGSPGFVDRRELRGRELRGRELRRRELRGSLVHEHLGLAARSKRGF